MHHQWASHLLNYITMGDRTEFFDDLNRLPDREFDPESVPVGPAPHPADPSEHEPRSDVETDVEPRRRRRWGRWIIAFVLLAIVGVALWVLLTFNRLERVPTNGALTPDGGAFTNYLIVGTDSREGITEDNPLAPVILGDGTVVGERTDTIVVLRVQGASARMIALPRDLFLTLASGREGRINTAYQQGPDSLIRTVQQSLGVPIHHYAEVDLAGFLDLVIATGGVTIDFDAPAFDRKSGLQVDQSGPVRLDPDQTLAFVRSRTYTRVIDGVEQVDGRGDLGRVERQQQFLRAVVDEIGGTRNPVKIERIARSMTGAIKVDDSLSLLDSLSLARRLRGFQPETVVLPTVPTTTAGGAAVLLLDGANAQAALDQFR